MYGGKFDNKKIHSHLDIKMDLDYLPVPELFLFQNLTHTNVLRSTIGKQPWSQT